MIKKHLILLICILLFLTTAFSQPIKEKKFNETAKAVVDAFSNQDSIALSKLIDTKTGIYLLHRIGSTNSYNFFNSIGFSSTYPLILLTGLKGIQWMPMQYSILPIFNCNDEKWSKTGLFTDTAKTDHLLFDIYTTTHENRNLKVPTATIDKLRELETISRRIVLNNEDDKALVFYLSYIRGRWYLTMIDTVTSDCSV